MRHIVLLVLVFTISFHVAQADQTPNPAYPKDSPSQASFANNDNGYVWRDQATAEDIFALSLFSEPLVPVGQAPTHEDNRKLIDALKLYSNRSLVRCAYLLMRRYCLTYNW